MVTGPSPTATAPGQLAFPCLQAAARSNRKTSLTHTYTGTCHVSSTVITPRGCFHKLNLASCVCEPHRAFSSTQSHRCQVINVSLLDTSPSVFTHVSESLQMCTICWWSWCPAPPAVWNPPEAPSGEVSPQQNRFLCDHVKFSDSCFRVHCISSHCRQSGAHSAAGASLVDTAVNHGVVRPFAWNVRFHLDSSGTCYFLDFCAEWMTLVCKFLALRRYLHS